MPASNSAIEATKRNRAMMRKPSLFANLNRYHTKPSSTYSNFQEMTDEDRKIFEAKMEKARKKASLREVRFYSVALIIILAGLYFVFNILS